ncbi:HAD family hydrolase [Sulfobacillus thermosulfidooxidans]|uniref:HAD family hydrolase n=1 Tax=Sulfobacillus thermosulfidooxidans TaxID=28034 RepID=UPI0006B4F8CA|nr:HAD-IA family hydrolase [Sulfobacillus thermosulfidooxidans]
MTQALLFDLDGTILDTTELIVQSFLYTFEQGLGERVSREEVLVHFGKSLDDQFRIMRPHLSAEEVKRLVTLYRTHNHAHHDQMVSLIPGAGEILRQLRQSTLSLAVVTSKRLDMTQHGLKLFGLAEIFQTIIHHDSTLHHKPHPEPILRALGELCVSGEDAWYIGDSPYDMMAAKKAGCRAIGFCYNTFRPEQLEEAGADSLVYSWPELYALWQKSFSGQ